MKWTGDFTWDDLSDERGIDVCPCYIGETDVNAIYKSYV